MRSLSAKLLYETNDFAGNSQVGGAINSHREFGEKVARLCMQDKLYERIHLKKKLTADRRPAKTDDY